jgi:hypothetical protein
MGYGYQSMFCRMSSHLTLSFSTIIQSLQILAARGSLRVLVHFAQVGIGP